LLLRLHKAAAASQRRRSGTGAEVQPEEVSRLPAGAGTSSAGPDAQGGDGTVCAEPKEVTTASDLPTEMAGNAPHFRDEMWGILPDGRLGGLGLEEGDGGASGVDEDAEPADVGDLVGIADGRGTKGGGFLGRGVDLLDTDVGEPGCWGSGHGHHSAAGTGVGLEGGVDHAAAH